jgi:2-amino-4-hydroxy-6-hydroxymethyldihydropteridine diphosphokinase
VAVAYIALGGNLGDRAGYLRSAVAQLESTPELQLQARRPLYDTEPAAG